MTLAYNSFFIYLHEAAACLRVVPLDHFNALQHGVGVTSFSISNALPPLATTSDEKQLTMTCKLEEFDSSRSYSR